MKAVKRDAREMKDSGIEWIGEIPQDWKVNVLFQVSSQVKNKNIGQKEQNLLSLSYGKIKRKDINGNEGLLPASFENYNIVEKDDIVLRLTDLQNDHKSLRVGRVNERGIITSAYVTLHPNRFIKSEYLYYLLHTFDLKKGLYGMGAGVRQGLIYDEIKILKVPYPPLLSQQSIADYLDDRCAKLDAIIAEAKASIEEYKELKQAVVLESVTKGLDTKTKMRESNIEWIGKYPCSWCLTHIGMIADIGAGGTPDRKEPLYWNGDIPWMSSGEVNLEYVYDTVEKITDKGLENSNSKLLPINTVMLGLIGQGKTKGKAAIIKSPCACNQNLAYLIPDEKWLHYRYLFYSFKAMYKYLRGIVGESQAGIYQSRIKQLYIPLPQIEIQKSISDYLDGYIKKYDALIAEKQSLIKDLEAYKKSLIYEVVTGKRKVVAG